MPNTVLRTIIREVVSDAKLKELDRTDYVTKQSAGHASSGEPLHRDDPTPASEMAAVVRAATGTDLP